MKVQEVVNPPRAASVVRECAVACLEKTYAEYFKNCYDMYNQEFQTEEGNEGPVTQEMKEPRLDSLTFWQNLISLIVGIIETDQQAYASVLNQYVIPDR